MVTADTEVSHEVAECCREYAKDFNTVWNVEDLTTKKERGENNVA